VEVETSSILFLPVGGAQSHGRRGAQNDIAAGADPIRMPMAVEDDDTRGIGLDGCQKVGGVDQCETDAVAEVDRSDGILHDLMMKQDDPGAPVPHVESNSKPIDSMSGLPIGAGA